MEAVQENSVLTSTPPSPNPPTDDDDVVMDGEVEGKTITGTTTSLESTTTGQEKRISTDTEVTETSIGSENILADIDGPLPPPSTEVVSDTDDSTGNFQEEDNRLPLDPNTTSPADKASTFVDGSARKAGGGGGGGSSDDDLSLSEYSIDLKTAMMTSSPAPKMRQPKQRHSEQASSVFDSSFNASKDFAACTELQRKLDYQHQIASREFLQKHCFRPKKNNKDDGSDVPKLDDLIDLNEVDLGNIEQSTRNLPNVNVIDNKDGSITINNTIVVMLDARYALKRLKPSVLADPDLLMQGIADMATESRFLASLEYHPNIVKLRGMAQDKFQSGYFIIMDKLGDTLEQRIERIWRPKEKKKSKFTRAIGRLKKLSIASPNLSSGKNPKRLAHSNSTGTYLLSPSLPNRKFLSPSNAPPPPSMKWTSQETLPQRLLASYGIASAICHLHQHSILYRDLKPANVGFDVRDDVKIFDFGLAKELSKPNRRRLDNDDEMVGSSDDVVHPSGVDDNDMVFHLTAMCGTPRYMAPEVALGYPYNESCDVYSFAILCWQILKLRKPYGKKCTFDVLKKVWTDDKMRPEISTSWPTPIQNMFQNAFKGEITKRPTMKEVEYALKREFELLSSSSSLSGGSGANRRDDDSAKGTTSTDKTRMVGDAVRASGGNYEQNTDTDLNFRSSHMATAKKRRSTHVFGTGRAMGMKADGFGLGQRHNILEGLSSTSLVNDIDDST